MNNCTHRKKKRINEVLIICINDYSLASSKDFDFIKNNGF